MDRGDAETHVGGEFKTREAVPIRRVLDLTAESRPREAADAEEGLAEAMSGIVSSAWPEVAWRFSAINGDGFPVEFTFSSRGPGVRYTAEVDGPEAPERTRIRSALRWARCAHPETAASRYSRRWQQGALRWGAWVGGAHASRRSRRKIYVEARGGPAPPATVVLPPASALRFVGLTPATGDCEWYFRRDWIETCEVGRLLRSLHLRQLFGPLREAVEATLPWPARGGWLVPADAGFSVATGTAFSVFTYARSLWGGDASIRRHILTLAARQGWSFELYERVTAPLERAGDYLTHHGVLAWIAAPDQPVELRISVRPPAA